MAEGASVGKVYVDVVPRYAGGAAEIGNQIARDAEAGMGGGRGSGPRTPGNPNGLGGPGDDGNLSSAIISNRAAHVRAAGDRRREMDYLAGAAVRAGGSTTDLGLNVDTRATRGRIGMAERADRSWDSADFAGHRQTIREENKRLGNLDRGIEEAASKELANAKRDAAAAHREDARRTRLANAEFQAGIASMSPSQQKAAISRRLEQTSDPMQRAALQRQAGVLAPKTGWNRETMSTGMMMNFMFGGWEVFNATQAAHAGRVGAAAAGTPMEGLDATMGSIDMLTAGPLGSMAGVGMDLAGAGISDLRTQHAFLKTGEQSQARTTAIRQRLAVEQMTTGHQPGSRAFNVAQANAAAEARIRTANDGISAARNAMAAPSDDGSMTWWQNVGAASLGPPGHAAVAFYRAREAAEINRQKSSRDLDLKNEITAGEADKRAANEQRVREIRELDRKHEVSVGMMRAQNNMARYAMYPGLRTREGITFAHQGLISAAVADNPDNVDEVTRAGNIAMQGELREWEGSESAGRLSRFGRARTRANDLSDMMGASGAAASQLGRNPQAASRIALRSSQLQRRRDAFPPSLWPDSQATRLRKAAMGQLDQQELAILGQQQADESYMTGLGLDGEEEVSGILASRGGTPSSRRIGARAAGIANSAFERAEAFRARGGPDAQRFASKALNIGRNQLAADRADYVANLRSEQVGINSVFLGSSGTSEALAAFGKAAKKLDAPSGIKGGATGEGGPLVPLVQKGLDYLRTLAQAAGIAIAGP